MTKIVYVLGVAFTPNDDVILISKNRPEWQAGKMNLVGGKVEIVKGEFPSEAMRREFREETGVDFDGWKRVAMAYGPKSEWTMVIYAAKDRIFEDCRTTTDEEIHYITEDHFHELEKNGLLIENVATYYHFAKNFLNGVKADMRVYYG